MEPGPESMVKRRDPKRIKVRVGLRTRLLLATLVAVNLAFLLVWLISTRTAREGMIGLVDTNLELGAQNLADSVGELLSDSYADGLTSSRLDLAAQAIETGDPKNIAWYSDEMVQQKGRYAAILVADKTGKIVASNSVGRDGKKLASSAVGRTIATGEWSAAALRAPKGEGVFVEPSQPTFLAGVADEPDGVVGFSFPVFDILEERIGTLTVLVSISAISGKLDGYVTGGDRPESAALVLDALGRPVALPAELPERAAWRQLQVVGADSGHSSLLDPSGAEYLVMVRPIGGAAKGAGWRVAAMKTATALEGPVDRIGSRLLTAFLFAVLLTTAVLVFTANRLLAPIRTLTDATRALGKASEYKPLEVTTQDEVGVLTASFNDLFLSLREHEAGLEGKVAARTRDLELARADLADILDNMRQGIFTVDERRAVGGEFSAFTRSLFEDEEIGGRDALELLQVAQQEDKQAEARMRFWLDNIHGSSELQWILTSEEGLREIRYQPKKGGPPRFYQLEYAPVFKDGAVVKVMVIAKDVTELRSLERAIESKEQAHQRSLARVAAIAALDADLFATFLTETRALTARIVDAIGALGSAPEGGREALDEAFRAAHTIKGNARIFHIRSVQDLAHTLEEDFQALRDARPGDDDVTLRRDAAHERARLLSAELEELDRLGRQLLFGRLGHRAGPTVAVPERRLRELESRFRQLGRAVPASAAKTELAELGQTIAALSQVELDELFERLNKTLFDLGQELGKKVGDLVTSGGAIAVDAESASKLRDVLGHALRNAVDHGLEPPDARRAAGKPEKGKIELAARELDGQLVLTLEDDGAGFDVEALKARAFARGHRSEEELAALPDDAALALAFLPGVTTSAKVTAVSGRGVGMDVVASVMKELSGQATIESRRGQGSTLRLSIPLGRVRGAAAAKSAPRSGVPRVS